ncbi:hypothetical protein [Xanthomonas cannabis]|uniref:hypothetical protein n=1 Tax=Xanthomonas cannabis TaxID=1885674 RepID=UPI00141A8949|nr:hypothetical protein [Xanthomonas cannabis]NIK01624.1 hypothetical protein [Xanthomonas cannabis]NIK62737.1 hypothetical protein [Xanthomonas cannabis]
MDNVRNLSRGGRLRLWGVLLAQVATFVSCALGWVAFPEIAALLVPTLIITLVVISDDLMVVKAMNKRRLNAH